MGDAPDVQKPTPSKLSRMLRLILFACIGAYLVVALVLFFMQRDLFYPRGHLPTMTGEPPADRAQLLRHAVDGGEELAIWLPHEGASAARPSPLMVYMHGNGSAADHVWPMFERYRQLGMHVLVVEYPGYAGAAGEPSEESLVATTRAWIARIKAREEVDADRVVYFGNSLGGGVACGVARSDPPRAFILKSTFSSMREMAHTMAMPGILVRDPYESLEVLRALPEVPVLLSHGRADRLIPFAHGERLSRAHENIEFHEYSCGHNGCPAETDEVLRLRERFLREHGILAP